MAATEAQKEKARRWRLKHPEKAKESARKSHEKHRDARLTKLRAYVDANREKIYANNALWQAAHRERHRELARASYYRKYGTPEGRAYYCAKSVTRGRGVRRATPAWVNMTELVAFYLARPAGMEVDHIVPLKGRTVSGLHVPWNLQYLPWQENRCKFNHHV